MPFPLVGRLQILLKSRKETSHSVVIEVHSIDRFPYRYSQTTLRKLHLKTN
ncbi:hypothetical protein CKA32_003984 [Geitlerinema sp. FC II]|nr:hypothetical protein CKA32_003984 [Geitlerinema sp. FC II]